MLSVSILVIVGASATVVSYGVSWGKTPTTSRPLPPDCVRPANGFLVVLSIDGYNDSVLHGVPKNLWPIINVTVGQAVNITVCNIDTQAHGFQIAYYYNSNVVSVEPGQIMHISFVADKIGEFAIFCEIFCSVHWAMQSGLLNVTSAL